MRMLLVSGLMRNRLSWWYLPLINYSLLSWLGMLQMLNLFILRVNILNLPVLIDEVLRSIMGNCMNLMRDWLRLRRRRWWNHCWMCRDNDLLRLL